MKKLFLPIFIMLFALILTSCEEDPTGPENGGSTGSIFIQSNPDSAKIFVDGDDTGKITPDSITGLSAGSHQVRLVKFAFFDSSFTVNVTAGLQTTPPPYILTKKADVFGPIRIYETSNTTAQRPSGLDLSEGVAVTSTGTDHDIYYSSSGFVIVTSNSRNTSFYLHSTGTDLEDGVDSPLALNAGQGGWTDRVADNVTNYFFLYGIDQRYAKMMIVNRGGTGNSGDPKWVDLVWAYNINQNDQTF